MARQALPAAPSNFSAYSPQNPLLRREAVHLPGCVVVGPVVTVFPVNSVGRRIASLDGKGIDIAPNRW